MFLRLGFTGFGGPAGSIALMKDEVVTRRRWMTETDFLDLLGATNLIPGPNSTRMAIHIGYRPAGLPGLVAAGACFIAPAAAIGTGALTLDLLGGDVVVLLFAAGALAATVDWVSAPKRQRQR